MIYTLTVNPAIDYHMDLYDTSLKPGEINRSAGEEMFPGGKGLNVSIILAELGMESIAWGFIAGKTGTLLEELAKEKGCRCDFIRLPEGETRINVKLDCDQETAINGNGPCIRSAQAEELLEKVKALSSDDTVILSGNLQAGTVNLYEEICREASERGVRIVVDTEGDHLKSTFRYAPFLIKPNEDELLTLYAHSDHVPTGRDHGLSGKHLNPEGVSRTLSETDLRSEENDRSLPHIVSLMRKCQEEGAQNILVTLGGKGALLLTTDGSLYQAEILGEHTVLSTVGAGDSTIAGFLAGLAGNPGNYGEALRLACAAGTATACCKWLSNGAQIRTSASEISVVTAQHRSVE